MSAEECWRTCKGGGGDSNPPRLAAYTNNLLLQQYQRWPLSRGAPRRQRLLRHAPLSLELLCKWPRLVPPAKVIRERETLQRLRVTYSPGITWDVAVCWSDCVSSREMIWVLFFTHVIYDLPNSILSHLQESAKKNKKTSLPSLFDPLTLALSILILFLNK